MSELVFLLEEPSAKAMLEGLLPRLFRESAVTFRYIIFEGKRDLEQQLIRRLRGYRVPDARFVILHDQDSADCKRIKSALVEKCRLANRQKVLVRIACHELESWYLADLTAVEQALGIPGLATKQRRAKYRDPDALHNPAEELERLTNSRYQKVSGSRAIGPLLGLDNSRSHSYAIFIDGLKRLLTR